MVEMGLQTVPMSELMNHPLTPPKTVKKQPFLTLLSQKFGARTRWMLYNIRVFSNKSDRAHSELYFPPLTGLKVALEVFQKAVISLLHFLKKVKKRLLREAQGSPQGVFDPLAANITNIGHDLPLDRESRNFQRAVSKSRQLTFWGKKKTVFGRSLWGTRLILWPTEGGALVDPGLYKYF